MTEAEEIQKLAQVLLSLTGAVSAIIGTDNAHAIAKDLIDVEESAAKRAMADKAYAERKRP